MVSIRSGLLMVLCLAGCAASQPSRRVELDKELVSAVLRGKPTQVKQLLGQGAGESSAQVAGASLLEIAILALVDASAGSGDVAARLEVVHLLLGDAINEPEALQSAILLAIEIGSRELVESLLDQGAALEGRNAQYGMTPLLWATHHGKADIVELLLERGADNTARCTSGLDARALAAFLGDEELFARLDAVLPPADNEYLQQVLLPAAIQGNMATVVTRLLKAGLEPDWADEWGRTPLHVAARAGRASIVRSLLLKWQVPVDITRPCHAVACGRALSGVSEAGFEPGANFFAALNIEGTPLHEAARSGQLEVVAVLLDHGAAVDRPNALGLRPLHYAAKGDHEALVNRLLAAGADTQAVDIYHNSAFLYAVLHRGEKAWRVLLEHAGVAEQRAHQGSTSLHAAVRVGHLEAARALLHRGLSPARTCDLGLSPLDIARRREDATMLVLLERANAAD